MGEDESGEWVLVTEDSPTCGIEFPEESLSTPSLVSPAMIGVGLVAVVALGVVVTRKDRA